MGRIIVTDYGILTRLQCNKNEKLIIIEDYLLRFITDFEVYTEETVYNTVGTLEGSIELYGKPLEILTDHGTQFFSKGNNGIPGDKNKFQEYLDNNGIKHTVQ